MVNFACYKDAKNRDYLLPLDTIRAYERDSKRHTLPQYCKKTFTKEGKVVYIPNLPEVKALFANMAEFTLTELRVKFKNPDPVPCKEMGELAALNGDIKKLKWLRSKNIPFGERVCMNAIKGKHFDLFKWAFKAGAPLSEENICDKLAFLGELNLIIWVMERGIKPSEKFSYNAAKGGHIGIIQWMFSQMILKCWDVSQTGNLEDAALSGRQHEVLVWLDRIGMRWQPTISKLQ